MDTITVVIKEIGGKKQLAFEGSVTEPQQQEPPVAAAAEGGSAEPSGSESE